VDRTVRHALAALTTAAVLGTGLAAAGDLPKGEDAARGRGSRPAPAYRLGEVRITGRAERPQVLFFLPRTRMRLLPPRDPDMDVKRRLLSDDKSFGAE